MARMASATRVSSSVKPRRAYAQFVFGRLAAELQAQAGCVGLAVEAQAGPAEFAGQGAFGEHRRVDQRAPVVVGVEGFEAIAVGQKLDGHGPAAHHGPVGGGFQHEAQALEGPVGIAAAQAVDAKADAGGHDAHDDQHHHDFDQGEAGMAGALGRSVRGECNTRGSVGPPREA